MTALPRQSNGGARPYHELVATVERLECELSAFAPMAHTMLRMDRRTANVEQRAVAAEQRVRDLERELRESERIREGLAEEIADLTAQYSSDIYRRGYRAGYGAAQRGRDCNPERSMKDKRVRTRLGLVEAS